MYSRVGASRRSRSLATSASAARSSSSPAPVRPLTATTGAPGTSLLRFRARELERLLVDDVRLRERDDAALDAEQPEDCEVLVRLRPRALVRVDDEQEEVDSGRAGDHRADEALVAGDVDDGQPAPVGQLERRVPEVDRDAARLLFGQPVGVLARQRLDERRLAMVDVTGGGDRQRHARTAAATSPSVVVGERAAVEQELPVADDPDDGRLADAKRRRERLVDRAREARQLGERERAAADARDRLLDRAADELCESLGARADDARVLVEHAQDRDALRRLEVEAERSLERGDRELVGAQRPLEWMPAQPLDEVAAPDDDARLRAAEELVAREADEVGAGAQRAADGRLPRDVAERARAEVVDEREAVRACDGDDLFEGRQLGEADDAEVRLVHAEQERGVGADRPLVVGGARAVRRPDLDEPRTGPREDVGDAEAVADLEQLAARDDDLASLRRAPRARAAPRLRCC